ncbi:MAG: copper chaperone PCu(A)C [Actinobacteria bacterium]|nr:copper chaperone PCu(A)C [Actinomycetota bacterium]
MKKQIIVGALALSTVIAIPVAMANVAAPVAKAATKEKVSISGAWVRPSMMGKDMTAGYMKIKVTGTSDTLTKVAVPMSIGMAQLHETVMVDGSMSMREVKQVVIAKGATLKLEPGSYHIMLMGLKSPITVGQKVPITLTFEKKGAVKVTATAVE